VKDGGEKYAKEVEKEYILPLEMSAVFLTLVSSLSDPVYSVCAAVRTFPNATFESL